MVESNGSRTRLSPKKVEEILHGLETLAAAEEDDLDLEEDKRLRIYNSARELMLRVESHHASLQRIDGAPTQLAVVRLAYDIDLFPEITRRSEASVSELASATGVEPALLARILRYCAAHRMIAEVSPDRYKATALTRNFAAPGFQGAIIHHHATLMRAAHAMPDFLAKTGYVDPKDRKNTAFHHARGSTEGLFDYFARNSFVGDSFKDYMASVQISQVELESNYDFERIWDCNTTEDTALFVDVGGGVGHQCKALRDAVPAKGRFILQDLPTVVKGLTIDNVDREVMEHDFFTEQPIKGAKVYYFRTVLHDWPDEECRLILGQISAAMDKDSVLLLEERVMPDQDTHWVAANLDLTMMLLLSALERSHAQWTALFESAGIRLKSCIQTSKSGVCIIEGVKQ